MRVVFLIVIGVLGGFALFGIAREWLKGFEARRMAKIAREEEKKNDN